MVVALFALSLVMVVAGIAAVIQGFPYVRLESGLAMVIGGATAASAGTILLGLSAVVQRLQRIEESLGATPPRADAGRASVPAVPLLPDFGSAPPVAPPRIGDEGPALAGAAGPAGLTLGTAGLGAGLRGSEPAFEDMSAPASGHDASADPIRAAEPLLPDLLPDDEVPPPVPATSDPAPADEVPPPPPGEDLFGRPAGDGEALALRSSLKDAAAGTDDSAGEAPGAVHGEGPQVVGTYASGGNTYVMYSTGKIEADTPNGRFTFDSLDELKAFVDSGGENQSRGAA